tara:strand:- start:112 stop:471 length:360 start_codon:yes stop_codon:yes gene_type:complete
MTIKLALLKSGEDVIADWHELINNDNESVAAYLAKNPYTVTLKKSDIPSENEPTKVGIAFFPWMPLSKEKDIPVNPDWVVTLVDPVDEVKQSYEEKLNDIKEGRNGGRSDDGDETDSDS